MKYGGDEWQRYASCTLHEFDRVLQLIIEQSSSDDNKYWATIFASISISPNRIKLVIFISKTEEK